jgi:hypothetical protein
MPVTDQLLLFSESTERLLDEFFAIASEYSRRRVPSPPQKRTTFKDRTLLRCSAKALPKNGRGLNKARKRLWVNHLAMAAPSRQRCRRS